MLQRVAFRLAELVDEVHHQSGFVLILRQIFHVVGYLFRRFFAMAFL